MFGASSDFTQLGSSENIKNDADGTFCVIVDIDFI